MNRDVDISTFICFVFVPFLLFVIFLITVNQIKQGWQATCKVDFTHTAYSMLLTSFSQFQRFKSYAGLLGELFALAHPCCTGKGFNRVLSLLFNKIFSTCTYMYFPSFSLDLSELGHSCKLSCELSARVKPTLSDVKVALIDMGMFIFVCSYCFISPWNNLSCSSAVHCQY